MSLSGYSGTPLAKKLGYKSGFRVYIKNAPDDYLLWLDPLPAQINFLKRLSTDLDMIHLFTQSRNELVNALASYPNKIKSNGMIWISWPKKSSGVKTDIIEDSIREICLPMGLVDIKVCAVNATWSALKIVIRKENR